MPRMLWAVAVAALLSLAPCAFGDSTASMELTGVGTNGSFDGIYIGPYTATINGAPMPVICDDFGDESYVPESWTAYATNVPNLTANGNVLKWGDTSTILYDELAYLATELASPPTGANVDALQYAIWQLADPSGVESYLQGTLSTTAYNAFEGSAATPGSVLYYIAQAENPTNYDSSNWANVSIYSFDQCTTTAASPCSSTNPPQEFIVVNTPEPATVLLLVLGLGALLLWKRRQRQLNLVSAA